MNEFAAKTLETRSAYYYLKGTDNLALYKKYVSGKISRDDFMKQIPASITKTIINETMSDETLPAIFKTIDGIMKIRGINKIDVIVGIRPVRRILWWAERKAATWKYQWRKTLATTYTNCMRVS